MRPKIFLHVYVEGEKSVVLRRTILVVGEKCCSEKNILLRIVRMAG